MYYRYLLTSLLLIVFCGSHGGLLAAQPGNASDQQQRSTSHGVYPAMVVIDAVASGPADIALRELKALGLQSTSVIGKLISGTLPRHALPVARRLQSINQIRISRTITAVGDLTSEGDTAIRSASARQSFNVDGSGVSVAVISDSYNCLGGEEEDRISDDLPSQVTIVEEAAVCEGLVDEGRAIMHLVHDIAPAANLLFLSGTNGYASTANGILKLVDEHRVNIIVDDAKSLSAPFFQKGVLAQAVEQAVDRGVTYITAAGNSARLSYQSEYRDTYNPVLDLNAHDFDPGEAVDIFQRVDISENAGISLIFQWDSPAFSVSGTAGAVTDLDIRLVNAENQTTVAESSQPNLGRDPIEILEFYNPEGSGQTEFDVMISKAAGPGPGLMKYILFNRFDGELTEYHSKSGTIFGHANSEDIITVGAGNYQETPAFGHADPLLEFFSSAGGGTPWLFDRNGNRLTAPVTPDKPDLIAPDNVNTELDLGEDTDGDGKSNFRGTSAAAPHVAGVAALMLEANKDLQPADIKTILQLTAVDVRHRNDAQRTYIGERYDFDSGYGLVDAHKAVSMAPGYNVSSPASGNSNAGHIMVHEPNLGAGALDLAGLFLIGLLSLVYRNKSRWLANLPAGTKPTTLALCCSAPFVS